MNTSKNLISLDQRYRNILPHGSKVESLHGPQIKDCFKCNNINSFYLLDNNLNFYIFKEIKTQFFRKIFVEH